jgi:predicted membrane-bound dolichyl-phosphate-mannose-protein mannosyltransferase
MLTDILIEAFSSLIPISTAFGAHLVLRAVKHNHPMYRRGIAILTIELVFFSALALWLAEIGNISLALWCIVALAVAHIYRGACIEAMSQVA